MDIRQPVDETDGVGECLAGVHQKYLDLQNDLENERHKGKRQQKQVWRTNIPTTERIHNEKSSMAWSNEDESW